MRRRTRITLVLIIVSFGNYYKVVSDGSTETIKSLSILAIGILLGVFLTQVIGEIKRRGSQIDIKNKKQGAG